VVFLFLSGVVAADAQGKIIDGDVRVQARTILANIQLTLQTHNLRMSDVVRTSVWLSDLADSAAFNAEYSMFFAGALPTRSLVQAALYGDARVEIEVQAWAG
jgi:Putative translation initiation inhibitor, yjgF family